MSERRFQVFILCRLCIVSFWPFYIYNLFVWLSIHLRVEKEMATHSRILSWRTPWRGAWRAAVPGAAQSDTTEPLNRHDRTRTRASQEALVQDRLPVQETQEMQARSLDREDPLEEGMATHPSVLAWRTPWTEETGGLPSMGSQRVGHD